MRKRYNKMKIPIKEKSEIRSAVVKTSTVAKAMVDRMADKNSKSEARDKLEFSNVKNDRVVSFPNLNFNNLDLFRNFTRHSLGDGGSILVSPKQSEGGFDIRYSRNNGSILIVVIFAIALLTAFVTGMLEMNVEQIQLMKNEAFMAEATAIAEAGLSDAFARVRTTHSLPATFGPVSFGGGSYSVAVAGSLPDPNFISTGTSPQGFVSKVRADVTVDTTTGSYVIRIDEYRINE